MKKKSFLESAKSSSDKFISFFPGKVFLNDAAAELGLDSKQYVELICSSLKAPEGETLKILGNEIENALRGILPERTIKSDSVK